MRMGSCIAVCALAVGVAFATPVRAASEGCSATGCHPDAKYANAHRVASLSQRGKCTACHDSHAPGEKGKVTVGYGGT